MPPSPAVVPSMSVMVAVSATPAGSLSRKMLNILPRGAVDRPPVARILRLPNKL